ncbi:mechanosensitive ion channel protein MscS [Nonlabens sp. MIC269]|uniref:mechanosensitive ion channel family protein n=1 Tax=Nonlabens TaxID=363408 RepID=UPI00071EB83D|nr:MULTISPECIES: mechanosensitive ion channel family protein [Nonlabens]ALM20048.1 mechanosensitive ion channel protein MscS [Nonlabens sp. MIC269]ARN70910.1 mechanosensitive ion channel protein MscS [Nonlabens tegetincola]MEE2802464.1 mechanosensitive ion channel family protein [Bacteroidota bacterium]PQJ18566.1 mechanosensitive ion channel protein MscS [Nonlabens tegetincola]
MIELLKKEEFIITVIIVILGIVTHRLIIWSASKISERVSRSELRKQYVSRYFGYILWTLCLISIILVWGINNDGFWVALGSAFAVVGVALFANWSILSNVTASFILYFTFPYKIGDRVRIHDKDLPVTATIKDIKGFYTLLETSEGEEITYPNNLLLQKGVSILHQRKESIFDITNETDPTAT